MSDSLKATVIVIFDVLTISASPELLVLDDEEPLLEPPRLPALVVDVPLEAVLPELEDEEVPLDEPDTALPGEMLSTETTVPLAGA
jgi:hypothetical protein